MSENKLKNKPENNLKNKLKDYIFLHVLFFVFSLSAVCGKFAAAEPFFSIMFFVWYSLALFILFIYAIFWQQLLKRMALTAAFMNRAVVIVWGMVWGTLLFKETITIYMIIGACVIFIGIGLVVTENE